MTKNEIVERELKSLNYHRLRTYSLVSKILLEEFGKVFPHRLSENDQLRLLTFRTWYLRYHVGLRYQLRVLVPYYQERMKIKPKRDALGIRPCTLCGDASEKILEARIAKDFPNKENIQAWKYERQLEIAGVKIGTPTKQKTLFDFRTPEEYVAYYNRITNQRLRLLERAKEKQRNLVPYRNNPFL